jgi:archaellin
MKKRSGVIGLESSLIIIAFLVVASVLAYVLVNSGFSTTQKTKTTIVEGLQETSSSLEVSAQITGQMCIESGTGCNQPSLGLVSIPLRLAGGGSFADLTPSNIAIRYQSDSVQYDNIYKGIVDVTKSTVYVADTSNNRAQSMNSAGKFLSKFGSAGAGAGQMNSPYGIAASKAGIIYLADTFNNRIQIFDSAGSFQSAFGGFGSGNGQFFIPMGVAVGPNGYIYVADTFNHRIQIFDSAGNFKSKFGSFGAGNGQFNSPTRVSVDESGKIFVADTSNHRIQVFDSSGSFLFRFGSFGVGNGQFSSPYGIEAKKDRIFVADTLNYRIQVFSSSGSFLFRFGSFGAANGQFNFPYEVDVDDDSNIYVIDSSNNRVQIFNSYGVFLSAFGTAGSGNGQFNVPRGLSVLSYDGSTATSVGLGASQGLFTTKIISGTGPTVATTSSWIYWSSSTPNSVLNYGEDAVLVISFVPSERPKELEEFRVEAVQSSGPGLIVQRGVPAISGSVVDLG